MILASSDILETSVDPGKIKLSNVRSGWFQSFIVSFKSKRNIKFNQKKNDYVCRLLGHQKVCKCVCKFLFLLDHGYLCEDEQFNKKYLIGHADPIT